LFGSIASKKIVDNTFMPAECGRTRGREGVETLDFGFNARKYWQKVRDVMGLNVPGETGEYGLYGRATTTARPSAGLIVRYITYIIRSVLRAAAAESGGRGLCENPARRRRVDGGFGGEGAWTSDMAHRIPLGASRVSLLRCW